MAETILRKIGQLMLWITGSFKRREAGGFEGRAAHGSGVGAVENVGDFAIQAKYFDIWNSRKAEQPPPENSVP